MLRIEILPAGHGDCLWLEYGDPHSPRRILIDGGAKGTYKRSLAPRLRRLGGTPPRFDLLVVTHIDADHITGALDLLEDPAAGFQAEDIWFNGYRHLPDEAPDTLGPVQGERLTDLLVKPGRRWNQAFGGQAVVVPPGPALPRIELAGGLILTLLSPTPTGLAKLKPDWEKEVRKAGLDPNRAAEEQAAAEGIDLLGAAAPEVEALVRESFAEDESTPNGSSIALLAEYQGRRLLLAGDAHPGVLTAAIGRLSGGKLKLDLCKLPHHGSKANLSRELLEVLDCPVYVFSTNGAYFDHPDQQAVARVIKHGGAGPELLFNYRSKLNTVWESRPLRDRYGYRAVFPAPGAEGVSLAWE